MVIYGARYFIRRTFVAPHVAAMAAAPVLHYELRIAHTLRGLCSRREVLQEFWIPESERRRFSERACLRLKAS